MTISMYTAYMALWDRDGPGQSLNNQVMAADQGCLLLLVFLDPSTVFDTIDYNSFLGKLDLLGPFSSFLVTSLLEPIMWHFEVLSKC